MSKVKEALAEADYRAHPTYCIACDNVEAGSRKQPSYRWLCRAHKRLFNDGFVDPSSWSNAEPFLRCRDVNAGACPLFSPLPEPIDGGDHEH